MRGVLSLIPTGCHSHRSCRSLKRQPIDAARDNAAWEPASRLAHRLLPPGLAKADGGGPSKVSDAKAEPQHRRDSLPGAGRRMRKVGHDAIEEDAGR